MLKKLLFLLCFCLVGTSLSAQTQDDLFWQLFHTMKTEPDTIFIPFNESIPKPVLEVKEKSLVAVRSTFPKLGDDQRITKDHFFTVGFPVSPNYVLTVLHLLTDYPALWQGNKDFPTVIEVSDGYAVFTTSLVSYDVPADLALLKINSPNEDGKVFHAQPVKLAQVTYFKDPNSNSAKALYNKFYSFSFYLSDPHLFFVLEFGPYRAITNSFDLGYVLDVPMGMVQGSGRPGFSGGPLLSTDGLVMGVLARVLDNYTLVILPETIDHFLKSVKEKSEPEPLKVPEPKK